MPQRKSKSWSVGIDGCRKEENKNREEEGREIRGKKERMGEKSGKKRRGGSQVKDGEGLKGACQKK